MNKNTLHNWQEYIYDIVVNISYILLIISSFGISSIAPKYLAYLDYYIRVYICLFLMWRFHPFKSHYEFTELDRKISFSAGAFIFTSTMLDQYTNNIINYISNYI